MKAQNKICSRDTLTGYLVDRITAAMPESNDGTERLYRFEADVDCPEALDWLSVQNKYPRIYWSNRDGSFETAGLNAAAIVRDSDNYSLAEALGDIENATASAEGTVRFFGGISFDREDSPAESWERFGRFYFLVPEFEICREDQRVFFAHNVVYKPNSRRDQVIATLLKSMDELIFEDQDAQQPVTAHVLSRTDFPDKSRWEDNIRRAIDALRSKDIQKIVLSRKSVFQMSEAIDPMSLLKQAGSNSISTYDFGFQLDEADAFIGCSPECLYRKDQNDIYSEAIAGTCLAGESGAEQQEYKNWLLNSQKDSEEHKYVFDEIQAGLNEICSRTDVHDQRDILTLSYVQHFFSKLGGVLRDGIGTEKIIDTLHPTSAVHGYPRKSVKEEIRKHEPFSRGWYAGPIGWIGKDSSEFAVGIRSGLIHNDEILLFAGAGIVKSSEPSSEWDETEHKLRHFVEVIRQFEPS